MTAGVYAITAPSGGQYIGSAVVLTKRRRAHWSALRRGDHKNFKLQNAFRKYGDRLTFAVLVVCRPCDLLRYEQAAMVACKPQYNICPVAGNHLGIKRGAATRAKMSARLKGRAQSPELIRARAAGMVGHVVTDETRAKLAAQRGWKHTEEAKAKMRGRKVSAETRERLRTATTGKPGYWRGKTRAHVGVK